MRDRQTMDCDCCEGLGTATPRRIDNPPGQAAIDYRIGRHADYLTAMQARLSSAENPALAALTTREASDLSLAISDALACSLDVLGFYTERFTQEHYLRTATERLSVREMAHLIGYRLKPGVAAATHLAFTLQDTPGAPVDPITIPVGTRVQSVPGQDEQAQTFETVDAASARPAWNALAVQHDARRIPTFGDTELWLAGSATRLEPGHLLLIVGNEHEHDLGSERWDVRVLTEVTPFPARDLTRVRWATGLGHDKPFVLPAAEGVRVYTFRSRATAFGANASDWRALSDEAKAGYIGLLDSAGSTYPDGLTAADHDEWPDFTVLAPVYPERREGDGGGIEVFVPATIAEVAAAAQGAAQGAAASALHKAASAGTGMVMAGGQIAEQATGLAQQSAEALSGVARAAVDEVTQRARTLVSAQGQALQALQMSAEQLIEHSAFEHARQLVADRLFDVPAEVQALIDAGVSYPRQVAEQVLDRLAASLDDDEVLTGLIPDLQPIWDEAIGKVVGRIQGLRNDISSGSFVADWLLPDADSGDSATGALNEASEIIDALIDEAEISGETSADIVRDVVVNIRASIGEQFADTDMADLVDVGGVVDTLNGWTGSLLDVNGQVVDAAMRLQQGLLGAAGTLFARLGIDLAKMAQQTRRHLLDTAEALNPSGSLNLLNDAATELRAHSLDAAVSALRAAGAGDVAALVTLAVQIARDLPAPFEAATPEALADVARFFAAYGVARAGGTPPAQPAAGSALAQILAQLPAQWQGPTEVAGDLLALIGDVDAVANAQFVGASEAQQQILAQVDKALAGHFTIGPVRRRPLVRSPDTIDITPLNESVIAGGWALLAVPNSIELYRITSATSASRAEYLLTGQTTRLRLRGELPGGRLPAEFEHAVRALAVHIESEELALAATPLASPLYGDRVSLDRIAEDLVPGQALALFGKRPRIRIGRDAGDPAWIGENGEQRQLAAGDSLVLLQPPERLVRFPVVFFAGPFGPFGPSGGVGGGSFQAAKPGYHTLAFHLEPDAFADAIGQAGQRLRLVLADRDGAVGRVELRGSDFALTDPEDDDPEVAEIVHIAASVDAVSQDRWRSHLRLAAAMRHVYARRGTRLNANCAAATHGESVEQLLGSGDGSKTNQAFQLNQAPLTHIGADTPSGSASTLEVRINDILWQEQRSLYRAAPSARAYRTLQDDDGNTKIEFGDGIEGARLPGGESNVRARYRKGIGVAGNVAAGKLTTLLSRPLGVAEAVNPEAASGGEDGETLARARANAPLTVLTLDRAVSITDYADYARAFAGIDKAHALWVPAGPARGVCLTIAGVDGAAVPASGQTFANLGASLRRFGDPLVPLRIVNHRDARFTCRLAIKVRAGYEIDPVVGAVEAALRDRFAFAQRDFGQAVSVDEVTAVAQGVSGVEAVHATRLHRLDQPPCLEPRLFAALPVGSLNGLPAAAELLTIRDGPIELEVLP
jgi:hypothetical protein